LPVTALLSALLFAAGTPPAVVAAPGPPAREEVYRVHLPVDVPVTLVAASAGVVRILWRDELTRTRCPCDPDQVNALDRPAVGNSSRFAGDAANITVYGIMAAVPLADLADVGASRALGADLVVYLETLAVNTFLQNAVNFATSRPRPRSYANDPKFVDSGEGYLSFYAGHVATAFAAMSAASFTIGRRHGARVWPWIVTAAVAGSVAVERVASGDHFPTDVGVAAVMGTATGIAVPWLHLRAPGADLPLAIAPGPEGRGLSVAARF
jgi:membrane-associated phospholipid phosphatase